MKHTAPLPLFTFRGFTVLVLLGLVVHLLNGSKIFILPYLVTGWIIAGVLVLMLVLSWVRRPMSAYAIAVFIPLLPAAFFTGLWLIVLKRAPVWEFILVDGSLMLLPLILSVQMIRNGATRNYFRFSSTLPR